MSAGDQLLYSVGKRTSLHRVYAQGFTAER